MKYFSEKKKLENALDKLKKLIDEEGLKNLEFLLKKSIRN